MTTTQPSGPTPNATPDDYSADHDAAGRVSTAPPLSPTTTRRAGLIEAAETAPIKVRRSSSASLRARKYEITLAVVEQHNEPDGKGGVRVVYEQTDEREQVGIRLDNNALAEIEERWGSSAEWTRCVNAQPIKSLRDTIAIALERDVREIGAAMLTEEKPNYMVAVGLAFAVANGVDPTKLEAAIELIEQGATMREAYRAVGIGE